MISGHHDIIDAMIIGQGNGEEDMVKCNDLQDCSDDSSVGKARGLQSEI